MEIRDYIKGDEEKILELFHSTFGKLMSKEYWKWRFLDNPEDKIMIKLMWDNEILAGHYALSPIKLNCKGTAISTALSMTTMTHPDYAGRGIFTELAEALYNDEAKNSGLKAVWGFPNNNSHYGFVKNLKWVNLEQIPTFSIDVKKIKECDFSDIFNVSKFDNNHISIQKIVTRDYKVKVEKSIDYLTWRYLKNPVNNYEIFEMQSVDISCYAVTKVFTSFVDKNKFEVDIVELVFFDDFDSLYKLMFAIKSHFKHLDLIKINTWLPLSDSKHALLEKMGFVNSLPITYSGIRILDTDYNHLEDSKDWLYSMGDSDVY